MVLEIRMNDSIYAFFSDSFIWSWHQSYTIAPHISMTPLARDKSCFGSEIGML